MPIRILTWKMAYVGSIHQCVAMTVLPPHSLVKSPLSTSLGVNHRVPQTSEDPHFSWAWGIASHDWQVGGS